MVTVTLEGLQELIIPASILTPESSDVRKSIMKTAMHVINNGASFETKLKNSQEHNQEFSFLQESDIHYDYYRYLIDTHAQSNSKAEVASNTTDKQPLTDPLEFAFTAHKDHPISLKDLEIIKLAALSCSLYDYNSTYENLKMRYEDNSQFDFLEPDHSLYAVFQNFLEQYRLLFRKSSEDLGTGFIIRDVETPNWKESLLETCYLKGVYTEHLQEQNFHHAQLLKTYKLRFNAMNWSGFKVVDKFESLSASDTPQSIKPALDFKDLQKNLLLSSQSKILSQYFNLESQKSIKEESKKRKNKKKIVIRASGETRMDQQKKRLLGSDIRDGDTESSYIRCPITGQMVLESAFDSHIKMLLQDPNHSKDKLRFQEKNNLTNLTDHEVYENIKKLNPNKKPRI